MKTSHEWVTYFTYNLQQQRINWQITPNITPQELSAILPSLQAWQLGETSDGASLIKACTKYATHINDPQYVNAIRLFIKEEQKHGNNLGKYLDGIQQPRIQQNWGDTLFRKIRHFNTSMQWWTLTVITVESAAQIFYQCLKDATNCLLLKQICTDILIDEAPHIQFQLERFSAIFNQKNPINKKLSLFFYQLFFTCTAYVIWISHYKLFKAGGVNFKHYQKKMNAKYYKTIGKLPAINITKEASFYQYKQSFAHSLLHSFNGIRHFFMHERNGKIEAVAAIATIVAAIIFKINTSEWLAILLCIGFVISAEMLNASLEQLCNKVEINYHPTIKIVKDVAAGAVLFAALISVAMASIIFLPKLL